MVVCVVVMMTGIGMGMAMVMWMVVGLPRQAPTVPTGSMTLAFVTSRHFPSMWSTLLGQVMSSTAPFAWL